MNTILFPTHTPTVHLNVRPDRHSDMEVIREIWCEDVYHVHDKMADAKVVVDLGANIGAFTCYALEHSSAIVIAIEPEPNNLQMLKSNIARVDPNRVDVREVAVGDFNGTSTIEDEAGGSRLGNEGVEVDVQRIDEVLSTLSPDVDIDIFKVDIEGYEVKVLMDMSMELQNRVKFFCIEYDTYSSGFGELITKLSETHQVRTLGAASRGAMIFAERY